MRRMIIVACLIACAGAGVRTQSRAIITNVIPLSADRIGAAEDLLIDLDAPALVARFRSGVADQHLAQRQPLVATWDASFAVGPYMSVDPVNPLGRGIGYRNLLTGELRLLAIANGASGIVAHPRRLAVYVGLANGRVGVLDASGLRSASLCGSTASYPSAIAMSPSGGALYVACFEQVLVVDPVSLAEVRRFAAAHSISQMHVVAGERLFTLEYAGGPVFAVREMAVYDSGTGTRLVHLPTPIADRNILWALPTPSGARVMVIPQTAVGSYEGRPFVFDVAALAVIDQWPIDDAFRLAFTPDETRAIVLRHSGTSRIVTASIFDLAAKSVTAEAPIGYAWVPDFSGVVVIEPPRKPIQFTAGVQNRTVSLAWALAASSPGATDYQLEAGLTPTSFTLQTRRLGSASTTLDVPAVPPGTYYVRIRGVNGAGLGPPSDVVMVQVR